MSRRPLVLLVLTLLVGSFAPAALGGCNADTGTVVYVTLRGRLAMHTPATIDIQVSNAGGTASQAFTLDASQRLPLTFTVTPTGRTGVLKIAATSHFGDGLSAGRGTAEVTIVPDKRVDVDLVLAPDDFLVNESIVSAQKLVFDEDQAGRQIAVAPDGSFLVAFENSCPLMRCDVLGRLFDKTATPKKNGTSLDDGDLILNQASIYAETPVIAGGKSSFFAAWVTPAAPPRADADLRATVLGLDGAHPQTIDIDVSVDAADDLAPTVFALADGTFVVVWQRDRPDASHEIRARLFNAQGAPLVNNVTHTAGDFAVSSAATGNQIQAHGAGLAGGGFVIVWIAPVGATGNNVVARLFDAQATPLAADLPLTTYNAAKVIGPRVAATKDGFVAGWQAGGIPQVANQPLMVRLFDASGAPRSTEIPAAPHTVSLTVAPALAVRPSDGAIGVTWPECNALGDPDMSCGIRFRLLRPSGQPMGEIEGVNTTTKNTQAAPSIAAVTDGGFVVGWTDDSKLPPDNNESGVRARVIYPALDRHDGRLGALCAATEDAPCLEGLTCQPDSDGKQLCHTACTNACPGGGTCVNGAYCAFQ
jgi:hypothetical protein